MDDDKVLNTIMPNPGRGEYWPGTEHVKNEVSDRIYLVFRAWGGLLQQGRGMLDTREDLDDR